MGATQDDTPGCEPRGAAMKFSCGFRFPSLGQPKWRPSLHDAGGRASRPAGVDDPSLYLDPGGRTLRPSKLPHSLAVRTYRAPIQKLKIRFSLSGFGDGLGESALNCLPGKEELKRELFPKFVHKLRSKPTQTHITSCVQILCGTRDFF